MSYATIDGLKASREYTNICALLIAYAGLPTLELNLFDSSGYSGNEESTIATDGRTATGSVRVIQNNFYDPREWIVSVQANGLQKKLFDTICKLQASGTAIPSLTDLTEKVQSITGYVNPITFYSGSATNEFGYQEGFGTWNIFIDRDAKTYATLLGGDRWQIQFTAKEVF